MSVKIANREQFCGDDVLRCVTAIDLYFYLLGLFIGSAWLVMCQVLMMFSQRLERLLSVPSASHWKQREGGQLAQRVASHEDHNLHLSHLICSDP